MFTARVFCVQVVAAHAQVPKVLNAPEDQSAAELAQSAAAVAQSVAGVDQSVAGVDQTVVAQALNVAAVDLIGAGDHDAVVDHNAGAFPHVAQAPSGKVVAHNYAQVGPDVARGCRFSQGVQAGQLARGDPFQPAAGSSPGVPAVRFAQAGRFAQAAQYVPPGFRFPLPAV